MLDRGMSKSGSDLRTIAFEVAQTLLAVIEKRDPHLAQHCERVANYCTQFCQQMKLLQTKDLDVLYCAGLVHDLGLIFEPSGYISASELPAGQPGDALLNHPLLAEKMLSYLSLLEKCLPMIRHHHEAWDGSGYPDGLKGEDIPLGARVLALFDRFDWITSPREPAKGMDKMKALEEILHLSGKAFEGKLVDQFAQFIETLSAGPKEYIPSPKKEIANVNIKEVFTQILQKFATGKIVPPVMPQVVQEIQKVIDSPNATADALTAVIEREPVIALRLISISNSPTYRGMKEISTVRQAIPRLGLRETSSLVMAIANKSLYETKNPNLRVVMEKLWGHSLATAYAAKLIARQLSLGDADLHFLMGLTHDIGKTFLLKAFSEEAKTRGLDLKIILANIQEAHLSVTNVMLKRWGFNEGFIRAVSLHEKSELDQNAPKDGLVVNLANLLTRNIGYSLLDPPKDEGADIRSATLLKLSAETVGKIQEETKALVKELAHLF